MWFLFALLTTLSWGIADLFYKKGAGLQKILKKGWGMVGVGFHLSLRDNVSL